MSEEREIFFEKLDEGESLFEKDEREMEEDREAEEEKERDGREKGEREGEGFW